jgi:hypothetical protein
MYVPALGNCLPVRRLVGQMVAFEHTHPVEEITQHPRSAEPRDAGADDDNMTTGGFAVPPHRRSK